MTSTDSSALLSALRGLSDGRSLTADEAAAAFDVVMAGEATAAQIGALLLGLRSRGESPAEVIGAVRALRRAMRPAELGDVAGAVDTCGTGGGRVGTLNVSTAAAFVVAGAGVPVAKHGNRSFTSRSGSADVLEALGVRIDHGPEGARAIYEAAGIVFLFAPTYHPAMRHAAPARRELGVATIMNLLGPLANPAGVRRQVLGVADPRRAPLLAEALAGLGAEHALVAHAEVGMDEISPVGTTAMWEVRDGRVTTWEVEPAELGVRCASLDDLAGGTPEENAARIEALLGGADPESASAHAIALNAAAALAVAGRGWDFAAALREARAVLADGRALRALARLRSAAA